MPLADDVDNDGFMDIVVATLSGNVYSFETFAPAHPLAISSQQLPESGGFTARTLGEGIYALERWRQHRDVSGSAMAIHFEIIDKRHPSLQKGPYKVELKMMAPGVNAEKATAIFNKPGVYRLILNVPRKRTKGRVELTMVDGSFQRHKDAFSLSFHMQHYRALKWVLFFPLLAAGAAVLQATQPDDSLLPSHLLGH